MLASDESIKSTHDDEFGRGPLARRIAVDAISATADGGVVIGLCGRWGSGKTSVARMAIEQLERDGVMVVQFNPWMFSGHDDLVLRYFAELTAKMGRDGSSKFQTIAGRFSEYASAIAGAVRYVPGGRTAAEVVELAASFAEAASGRVDTLDVLYGNLADGLRTLDQRVVVFIDDIDRLTDQEIRDVVRLVKSVGDLPNLSYILAFDREHVEHVLGAGSGDVREVRQRGRRYLEKIVQVTYDVPPPRRAQLIGKFLVRQLQPALDGAGVDAVECAVTLQTALIEMVQTPRDANRLANAVAAGLEFHAGEIATVDIVGLEALRVLEPEVHGQLERLADILFGETWAWRGREGKPDDEGDEKRQRLDRVLKSARAPQGTLNLLRLLFPAAGKTLGPVRIRREALEEDRANRVAVRRVFWRYVHFSIADTEVSSAEVQTMADAMKHSRKFAGLMAGFYGNRLVDLLTRLVGYIDDAISDLTYRDIFEIAQIIVAVGERLPLDQSPFRVGAEPASRFYQELISRLLFAQPDARTRASDLQGLLRSAPSLSARWQLLFWYGSFRSREGDHGERHILDEEATAGAMASICSEILEAESGRLAREVEMRILMEEAVEHDPENARAAFVEKARNNETFLLTLLSSLTRSTVLIEGTEPRYDLDWHKLTDLLGDRPARELVIGLDNQRRETVQRDARTAAGLSEAIEIAHGRKQPRGRVRIVTA